MRSVSTARRNPCTPSSFPKSASTSAKAALTGIRGDFLVQRPQVFDGALCRRAGSFGGVPSGSCCNASIFSFTFDCMLGGMAANASGFTTLPSSIGANVKPNGVRRNAIPRCSAFWPRACSCSSGLPTVFRVDCTGPGLIILGHQRPSGASLEVHRSPQPWPFPSGLAWPGGRRRALGELEWLENY